MKFSATDTFHTHFLVYLLEYLISKASGIYIILILVTCKRVHLL